MHIISLLVLAGFFLTVNTEETLNELVCENEEMILSCPNHYIIYILSAMYGKKDARYCRKPDQDITNCEEKTSFVKIKNNCNQRQHCRILASSNLFGDPCVGYRKYLEVTYRCMRNDNILKSIACELDTLEIKCPQNYSIKVVNALYGKKNPLTCYKATSGQSTNKCGAVNAFDIMTTSCDNLNTCNVPATNDVFGDPCVYTYKYLEVDYMCLSDFGVPLSNETNRIKEPHQEDDLPSLPGFSAMSNILHVFDAKGQGYDENLRILVPQLTVTAELANTSGVNNAEQSKGKNLES